VAGWRKKDSRRKSCASPTAESDPVVGVPEVTQRRSAAMDDTNAWIASRVAEEEERPTPALEEDDEAEDEEEEEEEEEDEEEEDFRLFPALLSHSTPNSWPSSTTSRSQRT
jgi:hypothetical protein